MASDFFFFLILLVHVWLVEGTKLDPNAGLKYYIIGGAILGIFLGIVVVSFIVLCWCCRLQKPKEDLTELKTLESRDSTRPKHPVLAGMAPRRDFLKKDKDPPYVKKPRLFNREESSV